jgi:SAM-dependent methyltransferase
MTGNRTLQYRFHPVSECNMCGAPADQLKTMGMRLNRSQGFWPRTLTGIAVGVRKCRVCELVFADPQPIPQDFADHYHDADTYWREDYFEEDAAYFRREISEALSLMGPAADKPRALDIGSGIGKAIKALESAGFDVVGIEPSEAFISVAIDRGIAKEKMVRASIEKASFPKDSFDFITFGAVLEHIASPSEAIERALQWLKPSGVLQIEVPSSRHLISKLVNLYFRLCATNFVTNISPMHPPYHLFEFGLRSFQLHGRRTGYDIALHRYSVCEIWHFPKLLHPLLRAYMELTNSGMQLTVYLRKN